MFYFLESLESSESLESTECEDINAKCAQKQEQSGKTKEAYCQRNWPKKKCQRFCGICTDAGNWDYDYHF